MAKIPFDAVFKKNEDGSLSPRQPIKVGGIRIKPFIKMEKGVSFGGIDFSAFEGHDLKIETEGDFIIIKGIY